MIKTILDTSKQKMVRRFMIIYPRLNKAIKILMAAQKRMRTREGRRMGTSDHILFCVAIFVLKDCYEID